MTRSTHRRAAALLAGAAVGAGLLLSGCSAGQIAETARKNPSVQGVNAEAQLKDRAGTVVGSVAVRDVMVAYNGPEGYERGAAAPLEVRIFNDTPEAVAVRVSVATPEEASEQLVEARSVTLMGSASPTASPTEAEPVASPGEGGTASPDGSPDASPTATPTPRGAPAELEIPAGGFAVLNQDGERYLRLVGLSDRLAPGMSVPLLFEFSNGLQLRVNAPVGTPLSPVPRGTPEIEEPEGGH